MFVVVFSDSVKPISKLFIVPPPDVFCVVVATVGATLLYPVGGVKL